MTNAEFKQILYTSAKPIVNTSVDFAKVMADPLHTDKAMHRTENDFVNSIINLINIACALAGGVDK